MRKVILSFLVIALILTLFYTVSNLSIVKSDVSPKFYVDDDYSIDTPGWQIDHFDSIQDAIHSPNCSSGDRIIVYEGIYKENLIISKSIDIFGEDNSNTIIKGNGTGDVITVNSDNVDISTFMIKNSGQNETDSAVKINANNCKVVESIIKNNQIGIYVNYSNSNDIAYNKLTDNNQNSIFLYSSNDNYISYNEIYQNNQSGIFLNETCDSNNLSSNIIYQNGLHGIFLNDHCVQNVFEKNEIYKNTITGIRIENSSSNRIKNQNEIYENGYYGIMIVGSNNSITNTDIYDNLKHGIFLYADDNTLINDNTVKNNIYEGIRMQNSTNNTIKNNFITKNQRYGIYINYYAVGNLIFNNFFESNDLNARDISKSKNIWNIALQNKSNVIKGPKIGGNYWDDYNKTDEDGNGIGDDSYNISGGNSKDYLPLMYRLPVSDTDGPYQGSTGEKIKFDGSQSFSPDGKITKYSWDFGDGNTKNGETVYYNYTKEGTYTVTLTVFNNLGGKNSSNTYAEITKDSIPPTIDIVKHGSSSSGASNVFTFSCNVEDNVKVKQVNITYWYNNKEKMTAEMKKQSGLYKKIITTSGYPEKVYCTITAKDINGNTADTKKPFSKIMVTDASNKKVLDPVKFDGKNSFDLDGNITSYLWDFGDGVKQKDAESTHKYLTDGKYEVTLTVTDNEGNTDTSSKKINIKALSQISVDSDTKNQVEAWFNVDLEQYFVAFDTNGDNRVDSFVDYNEEISSFSNSSFQINGRECFLLSAEKDFSDVFIWDTGYDSIINVTATDGNIINEETDYTQGLKNVKVSVKKSDWIFFKTQDRYPNFDVIDVKRSDGSRVPDDQYWKRNSSIYVLDDPDTEYDIIYNYKPDLNSAVFNPNSGGLISGKTPSVNISYNIPVEIEYIDFYNLTNGGEASTSTNDIIVKTKDNMTFKAIFPISLPTGNYHLDIYAKSKWDKSVTDGSHTSFFYKSYEEERSELIVNTLLFLFLGIAGLVVLFFYLIKFTDFNLESFIYFKEKKILPFFKPVVFGPLKIDVDEKNISKAEFYVNGQLKESIDNGPFVWTWNEPAFLKHNIEAKIYDQKGKSFSSGEMTFFVFNSPPFFKKNLK
ncbi:MAG: PKD domain-containing protein [Candidatus Thermoplasmatota archaeon]